MFTPSAVPTDLMPVLERLRALAADPETFAVAGAQGRADWLAGFRQVVDAAEAAFTQALAGFDANGDGLTLHGAQSTASWLRGAFGMTGGDATTRVRIARASRALLRDPLQELVSGRMSFEHVRVIEATVHRLPDTARAPEAVELLAALAPQVGVPDLRVAGQRIRMVTDTDGGRASAQDCFDRRRLHLSPLLDGMVAVDGVLDAEGAATLEAALAPFLVPAGVYDARTAPQRRADGLVEVARVAMASGGLPELSGAATSLTVVVPLATITGDSPEPAVLPGHPAGRALLPVVSLDRLACDATVTRVVLDPKGVVVDLGRSVRLFTKAQRLALAVRDGGCRFPGCCRPAQYADGHHLVPWARGGPTDLVNGALLCRHHHRQVHEGGWEVVPDDPALGGTGRLWFRGRGGLRLPSDPRGP